MKNVQKLSATVLVVLTGLFFAGCGDEEVVCQSILMPVCGDDGSSYGNGCEASVAGAEVAYHGACAGDEEFADYYGLECEVDWEPVCDSQGRTYTNECFAAGMEIAQQGECEG